MRHFIPLHTATFPRKNAIQQTRDEQRNQAVSTAIAALIATCAPHVHPVTMAAIIAVESAGNPNAVSINRPAAWNATGTPMPGYGQPRSASQAQRLVAELHAAGYTTSVGLAQINTEHLAGWKLPLSVLFNPCMNIRLAEQVLLECDRATASATQIRQSTRLNAVLSCFNGGDSRTGIANGYVQRVRLEAGRISAAMHMTTAE